MEGNTIEGRKAFLEQILEGEIILASGTLLSGQEGQIFETPCDMERLVRTIGGSLTEVASGVFGKVSRVCIDPECFHRFALKEVEYEKEYGTHENPWAAENVEVEIFKRLSALVLAGITPHVPLYLGDFLCLIRGGWYRYLLSEWAAGNWSEYLMKEMRSWTEEQRAFRWKVFFFQVVSALAAVQKYYPTFRHNDLHLRNLLYFRTPGEGYYQYEIDGISYYLPDVGIRLALWDFDYACMTGTLDNAKTLDAMAESFGMGVEPNPSADLVKFFNFLFVSFRDFLPRETIAWITTFLPEKFQARDRIHQEPYLKFGGLLYDVPLATPAELIQTSYFEEFRVFPTEEKITEVYDDSIDFLFREVLGTFPIQTAREFPTPTWTEIAAFGSKLALSTYETEYRDSLIETDLRTIDQVAFQEIQLRSASEEGKREDIYLLMTQLLDRFVQEGGILEEDVYRQLFFYGTLFLDKAAFYLLHYHLFNPPLLSMLLKSFGVTFGTTKAVLHGLARINTFVQATDLEDEYLRQYRMTPEEIAAL